MKDEQRQALCLEDFQQKTIKKRHIRTYSIVDNFGPFGFEEQTTAEATTALKGNSIKKKKKRQKAKSTIKKNTFILPRPSIVHDKKLKKQKIGRQAQLASRMTHKNSQQKKQKQTKLLKKPAHRRSKTMQQLGGLSQRVQHLQQQLQKQIQTINNLTLENSQLAKKQVKLKQMYSEVLKNMSDQLSNIAKGHRQMVKKIKVN